METSLIVHLTTLIVLYYGGMEQKQGDIVIHPIITKLEDNPSTSPIIHPIKSVRRNAPTGYRQIAVFVTEKQLKQMNDACEAFGVSRTALVRYAIAKYLLKDYSDYVLKNKNNII